MDKRPVLDSLQKGVQQLLKLAERLKTLGLLTKEDVRAIKYFSKVPVRARVRSREILVAAEADLRALIAEFVQRMGTDAVVDALTSPETPPRGPTGTGKHTLPRALVSVPPASLMDEIEAGLLTWEQVLVGPARVRDVTLSQVSTDNALMEDVTFRRRLLELRGKKSARAALREIYGREPLESEERRAQRIWARAGNDQRADVDGRRLRWNKTSVMVPLLQHLAAKWYMGRAKASAQDITDSVNEELDSLEEKIRADGYHGPIPRATYESVRKFIQRLPRSMRVVRESGFAHWAKQERLTDKQLEAEYANHIWLIDHTRLDINALFAADRPDDIALEIWATACWDAASSMPLAILVSTSTPDAFTTSLVLSMAIRGETIGEVKTGGLPVILRPDHGKDFMSTHVGRVAAALPITLDPAAPHNPDGKAPLERFFRTLNGALAKHPGQKDAEGRSIGAAQKQKDRLLTVNRVIELVEEFRIRYAQRRPSPRSPSPLERYAATVQRREPEHPDDLDLLLLKDDQERLLTRQGVLFNGTRYKGLTDEEMDHAFLDFVGEVVTVRYHPDMLDSVIIWHASTGTRIGEFWREEIWQAQVGSSAANKEYIKPLRERSTEYVKLIKRRDRAVAKADRKTETEAREREIREQEAAAGIRLRPTRAEQKAARTEEAERREDAELFADLMD